MQLEAARVCLDDLRGKHHTEVDSRFILGCRCTAFSFTGHPLSPLGAENHGSLSMPLVGEAV